MENVMHAIAVIVDVSQSRKHPDRAALQHAITAAFAEVNSVASPLQPLAATVGDEFQAAYPSLPEALRATLLARLSLPEGIDCRFGLGAGELRTIAEGPAGPIQDGSAWWAARDAIDEARSREYGSLRFVRTWYREAADARDATRESLTNAALLTRDHLVSTMKARERRLLLGQLLERTQSELAEAEGISQSAVSQNLRRSGAAALIAGDTLLMGATR